MVQEGSRTSPKCGQKQSEIGQPIQKNEACLICGSYISLIVRVASVFGQALTQSWFFWSLFPLFSSVYLLLPNFPFFFFVILRFTSFFPCFYLCFFISFHHLYFDFLRFFLHFLCFSLCFFVSFHHLSLNSCLLFSACSVLY